MPQLPTATAHAPSTPKGRPPVGSPALLRVPIGPDASPCDLLHETPLPRLDATAAVEALTFAFASGDGDVLSRLLDDTPVADSAFCPEDFAGDLELERFVHQCLPVAAQGRRYPGSLNYRWRVLCQPPSDRAHVRFRQEICAELASSPALAERLEDLYVQLIHLRTRIARPSVGRQDGIDRRLSILAAVRAIVECLAWDFAGTTSGLSRLHEFGQTLSQGSGYRRLCELLEYEKRRSELDVRIVVGFDGRIRSFHALERRENRANAFHSTLLGRAWTWLSLLVGGYRVSSGEILSRLVDEVFTNLEADVVYLFQLIGDVEVYLSALEFRRMAAGAGLETCLPELSGSGPRRVEGLFNPWLVSEGRACTPCTLELAGDEHVTFVTGANSGGKTRLLQSLSTCQLLGQAGLFVPAARAELTFAEGLFASLIESSTASHAEGRLGTELLRIRRLFERTQVGSMVVMDELCSGTNPSEGQALIGLVLEALERLAPQAFVTTHFLEFAARLAATVPRYRFLQAALDEREHPTYAFADGVAPTSLAHRVAERLGVTRESLLELSRRRNPARSPGRQPRSDDASTRRLASTG